jgi:Protein of unknown function (DUF2934)
MVVSMASTKLLTTAKPIEPMLAREIRIRAYELFERRRAGDGHALDDWPQAEYEVIRERGAVGLANPYL